MIVVSCPWTLPQSFQWYEFYILNAILHIYSFQHIEEKSFMKTLWKKVKLLKMSNFTFFFHNVFFLCNLYLKILYLQCQLWSAASLNLEQSQNGVLGNTCRLNTITSLSPSLSLSKKKGHTRTKKGVGRYTASPQYVIPTK